jgi:hypothetical protein
LSLQSLQQEVLCPGVCVVKTCSNAHPASNDEQDVSGDSRWVAAVALLCQGDEEMHPSETTQPRPAPFRAPGRNRGTGGR